MAPGYYYAPVRRRRKSGAGGAVVVALGFAAFLVVCGAVVNAFFSTGSRTPSPGSPVASSNPAVPGTGSRQAAPGGASSGGSSGTTSGGSSGTPRTAAADRLYRIGPLTGYGCQGRAITPGVPSSFAGFLNATTNCLDQSWSAAFRQAGVPFNPPTRVFWTTPGRSPCGDYPAPGAAAFYCPVNHAMYIGVTHAQEAAAGLPVRYNVAYAREVAHEYGHHIQDEAGILEYSHEARSQAPTIEERNAITRRSELQAQCLAGTFMAAVRPSFPVSPEQWQIALRDSYGRGDDPTEPENRDHGSRRHYSGWLNFAYIRGSTTVCDTWSAPSSEVS
jgi:predicted metalloprotease